MHIDSDTDDDLANLDRGDDIAAPSTPSTPAAPAAPAPNPNADPVAPAAPAADETDPAADDVDPATADPADTPLGAPGSVPYARFHEVNEKRKALQARIEALEASPAAPAVAAPASTETADLVATLVAKRAPLYDQVEEARLDGEVKLASTLQQQIDDLNADILVERSRKITSETLGASTENAQYNTLADHFEATYPQLQVGSAQYVSSEVADMNTSISAFIDSGMKPSAALARAVKLHFGAAATTAAAPAAPAVVATPVAVPKADVGKAVATINKQPADMSNEGQDSGQTAINTMALSDDEFDALPEQTKKKLRGDFG